MQFKARSSEFSFGLCFWLAIDSLKAELSTAGLNATNERYRSND